MKTAATAHQYCRLSDHVLTNKQKENNSTHTHNATHTHIHLEREREIRERVGKAGKVSQNHSSMIMFSV